MPNDALFYLSRWQFGFTAIFHFLFVPLTLGLTWVLVVMEALYVRTGKQVYKDMTMFWGKLLAINFAMGVITGFTMEFEFGQNWAYFARVIGGSFGPILAIEGITAFMLETTMFGLFFFGWNRLGKKTHFMVTILMAFGASLSIVNILAANSWMQHPVATYFDTQKMSLALTSILKLYINTLAQVRIGHVAFAGYLTAAVFVLGVSSYYLLKNRDSQFAQRSFSIAAGFGFIVVLTVGYFGDTNGLLVSQYEPAKMAAMEGQWVTQKPPAAWYVIAFPNQAQERNYGVWSIPYGLSIIATHSLDGTIPGLKGLMEQYRGDILNGQKAYGALIKMRKREASAADVATFKKYQADLGYGLLLKRFAPDVVNATPAQINAAVKNTIPQVSTEFWSFRIMVGFWCLMLLLFIFAIYFSLRGTITAHRWFLRCAVIAIPFPWISAEFGWVTAELGRQPWTVHGILPTYLSTSSISWVDVMGSLIGFVCLYFLLFSIELFLMFKYARRGPSCLGTGRYHYEKSSKTVAE